MPAYAVKAGTEAFMLEFFGDLELVICGALTFLNSVTVGVKPFRQQ